MSNPNRHDSIYPENWDQMSQAEKNLWLFDNSEKITSHRFTKMITELVIEGGDNDIDSVLMLIREFTFSQTRGDKKSFVVVNYIDKAIDILKSYEYNNESQRARYSHLVDQLSSHRSRLYHQTLDQF